MEWDGIGRDKRDKEVRLDRFRFWLFLYIV